eukprot:4774851-Amphidinium_carterae.2
MLPRLITHRSPRTRRAPECTHRSRGQVDYIAGVSAWHLTSTALIGRAVTRFFTQLQLLRKQNPSRQAERTETKEAKARKLMGVSVLSCRRMDAQ